MNDDVENLQAVRRSPWLRRAQLMQWFGLVMFVLAIGLAALTDFMDRREGIATIAIFAMLGLLALVPARLILARYLMNPEQRGRVRHP
ncbi:hypothetical protein NK553_19565 [Pseudomonas sp. ZM23]|uniref:Uncharacterized protein n=1 Tax=Pseudomonas triclosanedens TaxID=2961893 RepID=A0ABY6ZRP5_9PSED|nr:hypothetical protein [Pseudomonas triclosanedens]MCP8466156.1 hypothetical protein [Pseudomonas triclosanedens]MCP8472391.1 hypothetical protein [Pseudomonas triclosanedens]MCP8477455.1 hypothetical protein [Pseudomonas triclosanedens]WAI47212.1 hypothetical protein OU419_15650 [Pseudomonas triclosanedens]